MIVRRLTREDLPAMDRIHSISFHFPLNVEESEKKAEKASEEWLRQCWGCFADDGEMMAVVINNDFQVLFDGQFVKMGGIGGVSTLPEYRYGGAVKETLRSILTDARENGEVFSSLYPFSHEFYRKAGYEQFLPLIEYRFQPDLVSCYKHTGWTRRMKPDGDLTEMREIYQAFAKRYNMMFDRADGRYRIGNPFKDEQFTMLLGDECGARAFMYYRTDKGGEGNVLNVRDIAFKDEEGFRMCLGYLGRMAADYKFIKIMLPDALPIILSCFLFSFVWQWTDLFYSRNFIPSTTSVFSIQLSTMASEMAYYFSQESGKPIVVPNALSQQMISIGVLVCSTPLVILYCFTQKTFVKSLAMTGTKM